MSEAVILAPGNPQYGTDCPLIYNFLPRKIQIQNMLCTKIDLNEKTETKNNFCTPHVVNLFYSG